MSLMNNRKSIIAATVAAFMVLVIFGSLTFNNNRPVEPEQKAPQYQYVAAKSAIKKDEVIEEADVEIKMSPMEITGAYKATGEVIGRKAKNDIEVGKPIVKAFVQEIKIKKEPKEGIIPKEGFRAVPILIRKSSMPPYITLESRFDLATKENSMLIENLRILNILDPTKDESNKMLILEIKSTDVPTFIKYQVSTKGFIFLQKNKSDVGEYKFVDIQKQEEEQKKIEEKQAINDLLKNAEIPTSLPPLEKIKDNTDQIPDLQTGFVAPKKGKQVEVIVGKTKTKMEFDD